MGNIIAILNQKGGVGKTTTTINLAAYIAKTGKSVLIVDSDPQGNATSGLGIDKQQVQFTTYDILNNRCSAEQAIVNTEFTNLAVIPANANLAASESELVSSARREQLLANSLSNLPYDFILIDCPPSLGLLTINALTAANWLLVPVQAEYYAMEGLTQLIDVFQRVRSNINPSLMMLGIIVTMYDSRTSLSEQVVAELKQHFGDLVLPTYIPRNVRLAEAPSYGRPISEHDKWSKGARAYKQMTKEVLKRVQANQQ
ncbi:MAG: ParA family protein [Candidatus Saccharimonadales bacterium]